MTTHFIDHNGRELHVHVYDSYKTPLPSGPEPASGFIRVCTHYEASAVSGVFAVWVDVEKKHE